MAQVRFNENVRLRISGPGTSEFVQSFKKEDNEQQMEAPLELVSDGDDILVEVGGILSATRTIEVLLEFLDDKRFSQSQLLQGITFTIEVSAA